MFRNIYFANPELLLLLLLLPLLLFLELRRKAEKRPSFRISSIVGLPTGFPLKAILFSLLPYLRVTALGFLFIALARPQSAYTVQTVSSEGIDIILATDLSGSMLAQDFQPNRIEAAKKVAIQFVNSRPHDRIGLVVFSGESFTSVPLTTNHSILVGAISSAVSGSLEDGTAIGMGLATAVDRLRASESKSKVVILLTDGVNNAGFVDPKTAAEIAKRFDIRVYTIGIGTDKAVQIPMPGRGNFAQVEIDEALMKRIAAMTGGRYFRATDNTTLSKVYAEIDRLEKSKIDSQTFHRRTEKFLIWAAIGSVILAIEFLLRYTLIKSLT